MKIDSNEVYKKRLVSSFDLERYGYIMHNVRTADVSTNMEFQTKFNGFYRVRRNKEWRDLYYSLFEQAKKNNNSFEKIIRDIYDKTNKVEASFASKMYATLNPNMPIWDQYVLQELELELTGKNEERLENAIALYSKIEKKINSFLKSEDGIQCIKSFDKTFPSYKEISNVKKIDFFLWGNR